MQPIAALIAAEFIDFAITAGVLRFGCFQTKAGRLSPYFFNAGLFCNGDRLGKLAQYYARTFLQARREGLLRADMLYGPAYKGITLVSATAVALSQEGCNMGFAFNRKEVKDHGEGGVIVGAALEGQVLIVDDVISAGTSVAESVQIIRAQGAEPSGVLLALDREERSGSAEEVGAQSAIDEVRERFGLPIVAIATLRDLIGYLALRKDPELARWHEPLARYRERYGATRSRSN
jgi:orotate phosphoribosyltransferase